MNQRHPAEQAFSCHPGVVCEICQGAGFWALVAKVGRSSKNMGGLGGCPLKMGLIPFEIMYNSLCMVTLFDVS